MAYEVGTIAEDESGQQVRFNGEDWEPVASAPAQRPGSIPGVPDWARDVAAGTSSTMPEAQATMPSNLAGMAGAALGIGAQLGIGGLSTGPAAKAAQSVAATVKAPSGLVDRVMGAFQSARRAEAVKRLEDVGLQAEIGTGRPLIGMGQAALKSDVLAGGLAGRSQRANTGIFNAQAAKAAGLPEGKALDLLSLDEARIATSKGFREIAKDAKPVEKAALQRAIPKIGTDDVPDFNGSEQAVKQLTRMIETAPRGGVTGDNLINMQSRLGNEAKKAYTVGDANKAKFFEAAQDNVVDLLQGGEKLSKLKSEWAAQSALRKPGVIGESGQINHKSLLNALGRKNLTSGSAIDKLKSQAAALHDTGLQLGNSGTATRLGGPVTGPLALGAMSTGGYGLLRE